LNFNDQRLTDTCLKSVVNQELPLNTELLIIDNGSKPDYEVPKEYNRYLINLVHFEDNNGNIGGQNRCFEWAKHDLVLFVSNDVTFKHTDSINKLLKVGETQHDFGQIMPTVFNSDGSIQTTGMNWVWPGFGISERTTGFRQVQIVPSITYLMRKSVWKKIGKFDEKLVSSHEDVDMGLRLKNSGYKNFVSGKSQVVHLANQTLRWSLKKPRQVFQQARIKTIQKHHTGFDRILRSAVVYLTHAFRF